MHTPAADKTVCLDSGWVSDGHHICWNGHHGAFMGHTENCPFITENGLRVYLCSPGCYVARRGISIDDLPPGEGRQCLEFPHGSEPIQWRLLEFLSPELTKTQEDNLTVFEIRLDTHDEANF